MKRIGTVFAAAALAGTALTMSSASATDEAPGQFETNHTVSVGAGATVTYVRSCNESSSNPGGGIAIGGRAQFNETASEPFMSVVDEGITADGTGYFTTVKNDADRAYAYLSWAICKPVPVPDPEPTVTPDPEPTVDPPLEEGDSDDGLHETEDKPAAPKASKPEADEPAPKADEPAPKADKPAVTVPNAAPASGL